VSFQLYKNFIKVRLNTKQQTVKIKITDEQLQIDEHTQRSKVKCISVQVAKQSAKLHIDKQNLI